ncbi:MAG: hypothetical protein K6E78_01390 [Treponema sp.]|nr:hypothetical protein [Treponema sp.]
MHSLRVLYDSYRCKCYSPIFDEVEIDNKDIVLQALKTFAETKFDFVDSLLIARKELKFEVIFTFDKKLANRLKSLDNK